MRRTLPILTGFALTLGAAHLALSVASWRNLNLDGLWFTGSGLAIFSAALFNLVMIRAARIDHVQKAGWILANLLLTGFFGLAWLVLKEPQVVLGGLVFGLLSVAAAASPVTLARRQA